MLLKSIYIKNFKAFDKKTITLFKNNIFIGENDAGKSTILQALDVFFNLDVIDKKLIRNVEENVEIGVLTENNKFIKKIYRPRTFKIDSVVGNIADITGLSFVYISPSTLDVKKLICDLAVSKTALGIPSTTTDAIKAIMDRGIAEIIDSIDPELIVVGGPTTLHGSGSLKIESALKFEVISDGIPIEGRGSGYQKNVIYSLLTKSQYNNVIVGIDEIENSFSLANAKQMLNKIKEKFCQSLITTHSVSIIEAVNLFDVTPIISGSAKTVAELYAALGKIDSKIYILVEGKTDVPWVKKAVDLLALEQEYLIIACGGCNNIDPVKTELEGRGCICKVIKDGDTHEECSLSKECIELYTPLAELNRIFSQSLASIPTTKEELRSSLLETGLNDDAIKRMISDEVNNFLVIDNPIIDEIKALIT